MATTKLSPELAFENGRFKIATRVPNYFREYALELQLALNANSKLAEYYADKIVLRDVTDLAACEAIHNPKTDRYEYLPGKLLFTQKAYSEEGLTVLETSTLKDGMKREFQNWLKASPGGDVLESVVMQYGFAPSPTGNQINDLLHEKLWEQISKHGKLPLQRVIKDNSPLKIDSAQELDRLTSAPWNFMKRESHTIREIDMYEGRTPEKDVALEDRYKFTETQEYDLDPGGPLSQFVVICQDKFPRKANDELIIFRVTEWKQSKQVVSQVHGIARKGTNPWIDFMNGILLEDEKTGGSTGDLFSEPKNRISRLLKASLK